MGRWRAGFRGGTRFFEIEINIIEIQCYLKPTFRHVQRHHEVVERVGGGGHGLTGAALRRWHVWVREHVDVKDLPAIAISTPSSDTKRGHGFGDSLLLPEIIPEWLGKKY